MENFIISRFQAGELLNARQEGRHSAPVSLDLGLTRAMVDLEPDGARLPSGQVLSWDEIEHVHASENNCFVVESGGLRKVHFFSEEIGRAYSLMPTPGAPTLLVSGIPMHRIQGTEPHQDTLEKIKSIRPVAGRVLDTATGLGYTAIQAAKTARQVITIELDPIVLEVARLNPWSQALFEDPRITQLIGDSFEVVAGLEAESFTRILHDPPAFSLAGELYSGEFYRQIHRVLRFRGRLFHYVGDPESKSGHHLTGSVIRRLQEAGFQRIRRAPKAFGVVAYK